MSTPLLGARTRDVCARSFKLSLIALCSLASCQDRAAENAPAQTAASAPAPARLMQPAAAPETPRAAIELVPEEVAPSHPDLNASPRTASARSASAPKSATRASGGQARASGLGLSGGHALAGRTERPASRGQHRPTHDGSWEGNPTNPLLRAPSDRAFNTESYAPVVENRFHRAAETPLSTFSVDVDTASYANARRFLANGRLPPADAIRVEEWLNYFPYVYPGPAGDRPFAVHSEVASCPWAPSHRLVKLGIKGRMIAEDQVPPRNLVFLIDVSGSMQDADKLPLLKQGLALLVRTLRAKDDIAMVVYAGASGLVLDATKGDEQGRILAALERLEAGGSTNGGDGIRLAYEVAERNFIRGGVNRVVLASDGDFNVGTTSQGELVRLIEAKRKSGVFLTVLGFGSENLKDSTMELLADKGNGNYAYIDSLAEARKVLVREAGSTLVTIAKDVKLQVEFNPKQVASYKLIGYENRLLAKEDFNDDAKDAGEIGAGHTVTALYEVVLAGSRSGSGATAAVDPLKYQAPAAPSAAALTNELMTVSVRYKLPAAARSVKFAEVVRDSGASISAASEDFRFAASVANFALLLRAPETVKQSSLASVRALAEGALGPDRSGERRELLGLIDKARELAR